MMEPGSSEIVLVTGARGSLGAVTCARLAARGFRVLACDLPKAARPDRENNLVEHLDLDVSDPAECTQLAADIAARYGRVSQVVHLAGVRSAGLFLHTPDAATRRMFDVNYLGVTRLTRAVLPAMRDARAGRITIVTSVGALIGIPGLAGYCASKAATEGWAESVAMETHRFGISWSLIEPASFRSDIWNSGEFYVDDQAPDAALGHHLAMLDSQAAAKAFDPSIVADQVMACCTRSVTPFRWPVGRSAWARHAARGVVPARAMDHALRRALGIRRLEKMDRPTDRPRVLVTGASSGLGRALLDLLLEHGWHVIAAVRSEQRAAELQSQLSPGEWSLVVFDQQDAAQIRDGIRAAGPIDAVVANAGMKVTGPFEELPDEAMVEMLATNTLGTMAVVRESASHLRSGGRIVVIGSSSGFTGMPTWSGYAGSKFALERWADAARIELAHLGIGLTLVEPGVFASQIWRDGSTVDGKLTDYAALVDRMKASEQKSSQRALSADAVARTTLRALTARTPPVRLPVGAGSRIRQAAQGVVPSRAVQWLLAGER